VAAAGILTGTDVCSGWLRNSLWVEQTLFKGVAALEWVIEHGADGAFPEGKS
jgi:hypothetical protein